MEWTKEEMETLYANMQKKAMTDEEFRKEVLADANKALERLAGKKLPEGVKVKAIEQDPAYTATFVLPDFVPEEMDMEDLEKAAGGGICMMEAPDQCSGKGCFAYGGAGLW